MPRQERDGDRDRQLGDEDYRRLAAFRHALRSYLHWAEDQATEAGLTPAQHQLMLAIRARGHDGEPSVGELADELLLKHHSAVGLIDRAEAAGLVRRRVDPSDQRVTRIGLTDRGRRQLQRLAARHLDEIARLGSQLGALTDALDPAGTRPPTAPP